ncbi:hypothetical protein HY29_17890 [Hyphomonas beringensis]|uniref:Uncharacterized protein n=1 Tax=Hyphomonas beringensis TaxID=1280946 RepID=A0A062U4X5_9PROT|nr:hypothetical protein HY29_17890 [Hyphomonas beringensis]
MRLQQRFWQRGLMQTIPIALLMAVRKFLSGSFFLRRVI